METKSSKTEVKTDDTSPISVRQTSLPDKDKRIRFRSEDKGVRGGSDQDKKKNSVQTNKDSNEIAEPIETIKTIPHDNLIGGNSDGEIAETVEIIGEYLLKKRKWPMKGWHKRFFRLDKGILIYSHTQSQMQKGKISGAISVKQCAISTKRNALRIDIDEEFVYHLKAKNDEQFCRWIKHLKAHRDYCHKLASINLRTSSIQSPSVLHHSTHRINVDKSSTPYNREVTVVEPSPSDGNAEDSYCQVTDNKPDIEKLKLELHDAEEGLTSLSHLLTKMKNSIAHLDNINEKHTQAASSGTSVSDSEVNDKSKKKGRKLNVKNTSNSSSNTNQHNSDNKSSASSLKNQENETLPQPIDQDIKIKEEFTAQANVVCSQLKAIFILMTEEREKLKTTIAEQPDNTVAAYQAHIKSLRNALNQAVAHNEDLRHRLLQIQSLTEFGGRSSSSEGHLHLKPSVSTASVLSDSATLFYDAEQGFLSENGSSDIDDSDIESSPCDSDDTSDSEDVIQGIPDDTFQRRCILPAFKNPRNDISIFGLLSKNIGKDLSKISMPVSMNEPLSALQRQCEELEYSDLLDKAAMTDDVVERMAYVAAFAVSAYNNSHYRAGQKPFNPILGETYETIRGDRGFNFIAEQVSHHPPISACHADSERWKFWQDTRLKNRFWGKSLEIFPVGSVNLTIHKYNESYKWNKVTACVHSILRGQRWIEYYGDMIIKNSVNRLTCKLTFNKGGSFNNKKCDVKGQILDSNGKTIQTLFGKWNEGLYLGQPSSAICLWRPGIMPPNYENYYGFTKFAMELNEIEPDHPEILPSTDSRFRTDQRYLEEGNLAAAETHKLRIEELQRKARKAREAAGHKWTPRFFEKTSEGNWIFKDNYWKLREEKFSTMSHPQLW